MHHTRFEGGQGLTLFGSQREVFFGLRYEELAADAKALIRVRNAGNIPQCHGIEGGEDQFRRRGGGTESVQAV